MPSRVLAGVLLPMPATLIQLDITIAAVVLTNYRVVLYLKACLVQSMGYVSLCESHIG